MLYLYLFILITIFFEDFKERKVHVFLLLTFVLLGGIVFYQNTFLELYLLSITLNFSFLLFLILCLWGYTKFKLKLPFFSAIGLGDLLFFTGLAVAFPTINFLILFVSSLLFSLLLFVIMKSRMKYKTVPLAGFQAIFLFLILLLNLMFDIVNLYTI
ncbi:conserved membrane protein of unknown function [Tenacibaculum jejuense]|uniref:Prepilin type IV endopeptidase peptidase domain-containing protein n=1 Tax=Tenacibaculum jejuense TaxID=584609 RepID=A0A238U8X5_9FLAO|nr:conserved membrane protein of unknown function [Tenacibaculum jejuense]